MSKVKLTSSFCAEETPHLYYARGTELEVIERHGPMFICQPEGVSYTISVPESLLSNKPPLNQDERKAVIEKMEKILGRKRGE